MTNKCSAKHIATKVVYRPDAPGTWTYVEFPFSVEEKFGLKGRAPVNGEINGVQYTSNPCEKCCYFVIYGVVALFFVVGHDICHTCYLTFMTTTK